MAVITPYKGQLELLRKTCQPSFPTAEFSTVDGFQVLAVCSSTCGTSMMAVWSCQAARKAKRLLQTWWGPAQANPHVGVLRPASGYECWQGGHCCLHSQNEVLLICVSGLRLLALALDAAAACICACGSVQTADNAAHAGEGG